MFSIGSLTEKYLGYALFSCFMQYISITSLQTEVLNSPPLSLIPKNILKAPANNPTDQNASPAYAHLPNPSAAHPLRSPDQRFLDSEAFTNKFASHISGPMEKVTRRALKRWSDDAHDHSELGAALNGFSLNESGELSASIEKTGQAVDATYISTARLVCLSIAKH